MMAALTSQMDDLKHQRLHSRSSTTSSTVVTPTVTIAIFVVEVDKEKFKKLYKLLKENSQKKVEIKPPSPYDGKRDQWCIDGWLFKLETYLNTFELLETKRWSLLQVCLRTRRSYGGEAASQIANLLLLGRNFNDHFAKLLCLQNTNFTRVLCFDALARKGLWLCTLPNFSVSLEVDSCCDFWTLPFEVAKEVKILSLCYFCWGILPSYVSIGNIQSIGFDDHFDW